MRGTPVVGALLTLALAACGGGEDDALTVFAASSLRDVLPRIDAGPSYNFGGSDELAAQIRQGAQADVFLAASPRFADDLHEEGLVQVPRTFARNRLVIVVPADNPAAVDSLADLGREGVKLVLGDEGVPAGDYAREALERADAEEALRNVASLEDDVKGVVGKVALGEADAGIAYATDAAAVGGDVRAIELPPQTQPEIEYRLAIVSETDRRERAEAFVESVLSEEGQAALRRAGFRSP